MASKDDSQRWVLSIVQGLLKPVISVVIYQTISMLWYSKHMFNRLWQEKAFPNGMPSTTDFSFAVSSTFVVALGLHALLSSLLSCAHTIYDKAFLLIVVAQLIAILPVVDYAFAQRGILWLIECGRSVTCVIVVGFSIISLDMFCEHFIK